MINSFDRYTKRYDAWYDKNKYAFLSEIEAVKKFIPKRGKGLEIGVGTGRFAAALEIEYGIDPAKNMLEVAKRRGVNVQFGYGEHLPFEKNNFDYIAIIISLCFVDNPKKVLKECMRVLKENGRIIIGIIDKDSFLGEFYEKRKSVFYKEANFFNISEVTRLLENKGFTRFSYYQSLFSNPGEMKTVEKPHKGFGDGGFVVIGAKKSV